MRAGLVTGKERFELVEVSDPNPGDHDVVVAIQRCGVCGSDLHAYQEGWRYAPAVCGHEWVGRIVERGSAVSHLEDGALVTGGIAPGCGACPECRADLPSYCRTAMGHYWGDLGPTSGGFAQYLTLRGERVTAIPEGIHVDDAALIEPASVAFHAVRRSRMTPGDRVAVVGCGPIGLLTAQCARVAGAGSVMVVEPDAARRALALQTGADSAAAPGEEARDMVAAISSGLGVDVAFDCAGIPQTMQQSVDMVRSGGSVCVVGVSGGKAEVTPMRWMMKEVAVDTSLAFTLDEMSRVASLVVDGRLEVAPLRNEVVTLDDLPSTFEDLAAKRNPAVKVLVDPTAG